MWPWLLSLVSGWLPIGLNSEGKPKAFGEWAGKIIWVVGIVLAVLIVWNRFTRSTTDTRQNAEEIVNNTYSPKATFGCATTKTMQYYRASNSTEKK